MSLPARSGDQCTANVGYLKTAKTCLLEMVVGRQCLEKSPLGHHCERDTIGQGPGFIRAIRKQVETRLVHGWSIVHDLKQGICADGINERRDRRSGDWCRQGIR
jgi:hypothetical protein